MRDQYLAYMLRLWKVGDGENAIWRASLEDPHTGKCCAFANCEALFTFLQALTSGQSPPETADNSRPPPDSEKA